MPTLAVFSIGGLLLVLIWGSMIVLNLWLFQKSKAQGNLLMLIGAASLALSFLLALFNQYGEFLSMWLPTIGSALIVLGFYLTVKSLVAGQIAALKEKIHSATAPKPGGGSSSDKPAS